MRKIDKYSQQLISGKVTHVFLELISKQFEQLGVLSPETEEYSEFHEFHQVLGLLDRLNDELDVMIEERLEFHVFFGEGNGVSKGETLFKELV